MASLAPTRKLTDIKFATIHHAGVEPGARNLKELKVHAKSYDTFHATKPDVIFTKGEFGFKFISYHFLIARDGSVLQVQDIKYMRYHATDNTRGAESHNRWGIAILIDGNFDIETVTDAQKKAAAQVIRDMQKKCKHKFVIKGHRETAIPSLPTNCPGKNMGYSYQKASALGQIIKLVQR